MFTELDVENWPRKATYDFFRDYDDPFFNFTANVDVTDLYRFTRENGLSISLASLYSVMTAANEIREFRIRLHEGRLVEFDRIHATQTILNDDETFSFAYFEMRPDLFEFDRAGKIAVEKYKKLKTFDVESDRVDLIYFSVIPWVSFTSFKHATRLDRTQTVPRIVFGKIFDEGAAKMMPLSVEANHTIMDGLHVGKLFIRCQELMNSY
ncbi:MAG: chloramphenicol acetyltransferase [Chloracidobacterium sp.]|nr:chloramphenicol acetyltransferase [Chloracidobacterium sp.]